MKMKSQKKRGICDCHGCSRRKAKKQRFCYKHHREYRKEIDPIRYQYRIQADNAKRRGKDFLLTIEEFTEFCNRTGYIKLKGRNSGGYTIDRIIDSGPYSIDNIQILEHGCNCRKKYTDYWASQYSYKEIIEIEETEISPIREEIECPF